MAKGSSRALLRLVGELEDGEWRVTQLGLHDAAKYLAIAKLEIVKELARMEARRARVQVARRAAAANGVIPFPVAATAAARRGRAQPDDVPA